MVPEVIGSPPALPGSIDMGACMPLIGCSGMGGEPCKAGVGGKVLSTEACVNFVRAPTELSGPAAPGRRDRCILRSVRYNLELEMYLT